MTLFTKISKLHTFRGFIDARRPEVTHIETINDAVLLVSAKGKIEWCGRAEDYKIYAAGKPAAFRKKIKTVSLKGSEVLPAFVECHTHLLYSGSRAEEFERRNRGDSYLDIAKAGGGIRSTVRSTKNSSLKELETALIDRLKLFSRQGVATVEVKTGYADTIEEENRHLDLLLKIRDRSAKDLPRLIVTCLAAHSLPDGETEASWLLKIETLFPKLLKKRVRLDIFIEKGAFSKASGEKLLGKARAMGIDVTIHADQLSLSGGTALGVQLKAQSVDHVIEIGSREIDELARSKTVAVLLPVADMYTRLPYPKARALIDAGARVALATDHNPGTSPALDIALVGVLARTVMQMTLPEVLSAYTVTAAAALGLEQQTGALTVGRTADFIVLKRGALISDLFYAVGPGLSHSAVASVWRDGFQLKPR